MRQVCQMWLVRSVMVIAMIAVAAVTLWRLQPPSKDVGGFSTDAAMADLRFIASETHPVGSPHHQAVREFLIQRFQQLGYDVRLQEAHSPISLRNVIARKPGQVAGSKSVLLAAHYDSVRWGPGAADDGAAVAALLEVARILSQTPHRNDIVFLISDGEELGLWGARLFVESDPLAAQVGVALNFDARGTSGPDIMFETSPNNRWLIDLYASHAPHPVCSSLTGDIYRLMPNKTDFTIFLDPGRMQGLNFAFIGDYENYHSSNDDLAHLDPRSLRHEGIQALALAKVLAEMDLSNLSSSNTARGSSAGDTVYFDLLSLIIVRYSVRWAPIIGIATALLAMSVIIAGLTRRMIGPRRVLLSIGMLGINAIIAWAICGAIASGVSSKAAAHHADLAILGYVLLAALLTAGWMHLFRRIRAVDLLSAGLIVWSGLSVMSGFNVRGASYLACWPLLAATLALAIHLTALPRHRPALTIALLILLAIPIILPLTPVIYLAFLGLTLAQAGKLVIPVVLAMWLLPLQIRQDTHAVEGEST